MAAGTTGYSDTRSFSGGLGSKISAGIRDKITKSSQLAKKERSFAESEAEKQGTSLSEAGISKGFFFRYALGAHFGGDAVARTRGLFAKNPSAGINPLTSIDDRFRGGFDYKMDFTPVSSSSPKKSTELTDTVQSIGNQGIVVGGLFDKTKAVINKIENAVNTQTNFNNAVHDKDLKNDKKKRDKLKSMMEAAKTGLQNAYAGNKSPLETRGFGGLSKLFGGVPSRIVRSLFNPRVLRRLRNPRRTFRALRRLGRRKISRVRGTRMLGDIIERGRGTSRNVIRNVRNSVNVGLRSKTARRFMIRAGGRKLAKLGTKGVSKALIKKVPLLGAVAGVAFGIERLMRGDVVGALGEVASGVASTVPGAGTSLSLAIDAGMMTRDAMQQQKQQVEPQFAEGGLVNIPDSVNEIAKRRIGAKPLDEKFWMQWHTQEFVSSRKAREVEASIITDGFNKYFRGGGILSFGESLKNTIGSLITGIPGMLWKGIKGAWKWTTDGIGKIWNAVSTAIANGFKWVVESTTKVINKIKETATDIWNNSINWIKGLFGGNDNANTDGAEHNWDVVIPIRLAKKPNKIPDKEGGNTFDAASAEGDRARTETSVKQIKSKLAKNGVNVKIVVPEDFSSYEAMDKYINARSNEGSHIYNMPTVSGQMGRAASKARGKQVNRVSNDIMDQLAEKPITQNTDSAISMDKSILQSDLGALAFTTNQDLTGLTFGDYEELSSANAIAIISNLPQLEGEKVVPVPVENNITFITTDNSSEVLWTTYLRSLE